MLKLKSEYEYNKEKDLIYYSIIKGNAVFYDRFLRSSDVLLNPSLILLDNSQRFISRSNFLLILPVIVGTMVCKAQLR